MKKPIFYAVVRSRNWTSRGYYEVLAATTEKGRQVYGRDNEGASTHVAARDVLLRCATEEEADQVLTRAETIRVKHRIPIKKAQAALAAAERAERAELDALVR